MRKRKQQEEKWDPVAQSQRWNRENLERLRKGFESGKDPLALNEAILDYGGYDEQWVKDGLHTKLRYELKKSTPRAKRFERDFARWFTFNWLRNRNVPPDDAKSLGGAICGCSAETLYNSYKDFKKYRFPYGVQPELRGMEEVTPADVPGGREDGLLFERISEWYFKEGEAKSEEEAQELAHKLLASSLNSKAIMRSAKIEAAWRCTREGIKFTKLWESMPQKSRDEVMVRARRGGVSVQQVYRDAEKYDVSWVKDLFDPS